MLEQILIFGLAMYVVVRSATLATTHAGRLATQLRLSRYVVGFIVVAIISILPETFIAVRSALAGVPSFGLGVLFGSNVADLSLVFALIIFYARRGLRVESRILKNRRAYPFMLALPLVLGLDGFYSRIDGTALIIAGGIFYYFSLREGLSAQEPVPPEGTRLASTLGLLASMVGLLAGSHFVVTSATSVAQALGVSSILIGMVVVGVGTTLPELFFALHSVKERDDSLAIGDILGTVLADATIVVGLLALLSPFAFPKTVVDVTGLFMVTASLVLFSFMRSGRLIARYEARMLLLFWLLFVVVEFLVNMQEYPV